MKVIIAGGGTAGHINPGLAIAKYIQKEDKNSEIMFVGTKKGLETTLVPRDGFPLELIRVKGFKRKLSIDTLLSIKELFLGIVEARRIIKMFKPDIVVGTGGYVCGPVVFYAYMARIPCIVHEQNAYPGVTNKILSRFVDIVAISYEESKKYFSKARRIVLTGNPVKSDIITANKDMNKQKIKHRFNINDQSKTLVVFGGSRGAETINAVIVDMIKKYSHLNNFNIIFATGESLHKDVEKELKDMKKNFVNIVPYIYEMPEVLSCADLVVCRAGAITVSELTALGVPSILIPSPYVVANHQEYNARVLEQRRAAEVILEKDLNSDNLYHSILEIISNSRILDSMSRNAKQMGILDATEKIYDLCKEYI